MIAALPMYDFPQLRAAHDALWTALATELTARGIRGVPAKLTRNLDHRAVWRHPLMILAQACEYPIATSYGDSLTLVATPRYLAEGCEGAFYRSAIVVRVDSTAESLADLRGQRCVINEVDSNSGVNLLRAAIAPLASGAPFFKTVIMSGSHRRSVQSVAAAEADVAAIDCVTLAHLKRLEPELTRQTRILSWTPFSPSLPFVTSRHTSAETLEALRASLAAVEREPALERVRRRLLLDGFEFSPDANLSQVRALEREAAQLQYPALC